jgi:hypothetical protein
MQPFWFTVTSFAAALVFGTTPAHAANATPGAWPTYMHDNDRSGVSSAQLALPLTLAWSYEARHAPEPVWKATYSPDGKRDVTGGHGEITQHPAIANGTIYLWTGAYDLSTGKKLKWLWQRPGGGCGTFSSSATALFFRASNPQMTEFATGKHRRLVHETRPGCWINVIPAGGLVLIPEGSSGCSCNYAVQASMALAPVETKK